jgi:hypothetical protein
LTPGHGVVLTGVVLTGDPPSQEVQVIDVLENVMYQWILETSLRLLTIARLHALTDDRGRLVSGLEFFPFFQNVIVGLAALLRCFKSRQNSKLLQKVHNNNSGTFFAFVIYTRGICIHTYYFIDRQMTLMTPIYMHTGVIPMTNVGD